MWDTVKLAVPDLELDPDQLSPGLGWKKSVTTGMDAEGVLQEKVVYRLARENEHPPYLTYSPRSGSLTVETSLPKILFEENVTMLSPSDVPRALDELSNRVESLVGAPIPHCKDWTLRGRADAVFSWNVGQERVPDYLHALSQLHLARHRTDYVDHAKTVYWKTARRWIRSYDKYAECKLPEAKGNLRFEVEMKRAKSELQTMANVKEGAKAGEVLNWQTARSILAHWLEMLGTDLVVPDDERLLALLCKKCGPTKAIRLIGFVFASRMYGREELLGRGFKRDYVWRNVREIKAAGANAAMAKRGVLPGLSLPKRYDGTPGRV